MQRPRPPRADWATSAAGYAFPSGHTTTAAAVAVLVVAALRTRTTSPVIRVVCTAVALLCAVGVGLSRVYLGVHWATDTAGGWLLVTAVAGVAAGSTGLGRWAPHRPA